MVIFCVAQGVGGQSVAVFSFPKKTEPAIDKISFWPFTFRKFTFAPTILFTAGEACMRIVALLVLLLLLR